MSRLWIRIAILLCVLAGAAPIIQSQLASGTNSGMTVIEARMALRKSLSTMLRGTASYYCTDKEFYSLWPLQDIVISPDGFRFTDKGFWGAWEKVGTWIQKDTWTQAAPYEHLEEFSFENMDHLAVRECKRQFGIVRAGTKKWVNSGINSWERISDAQLFVDALDVLTTNYRGFDAARDAAEFEEFKAKAKSWRELDVKPELPEEARREKVLAEEAIREKDLLAAIFHYQAGLKLTPVWPQGHFNAALLAAEFGDYFDAVRNMKRYLELVPNAADAQAARDKLIVWEDKAQQQKRSVQLVTPKP